MTDRKVFAEGARAEEMPIPEPQSDLVDSSPDSLKSFTNRKARRKMFRRLNSCAVPGFAPICVDSNDPHTVECGFKQRLMRNTPKINDERLKEFSKFVANYLAAHVPVATPLSFEEWLATTSYTEARKEELRKANSGLKGGQPTKRQSSHIDSFVKTESYPQYKHARMINSRSDAFKAFSGPLFKAVENVVYKLAEFVKHIPVPDRPKAVLAFRKAGRRYFQTDFTAYESHFLPKIMAACEC